MKNIATVVESKACSGCGMCVSACPVEAIKIGAISLPEVTGECTECGICTELCPRVEMPYADIEQDVSRRNGAETYDSLLGYYTRICLARSSSDAIRKRSYWGGATTAFVTFLLEQGLIDSALLTDRVHNVTYCAHPRPRIVTTKEDILACAFTKPAVNPLLAHLPLPGSRVAVVGTSCHIEAVRKAQFLSIQKTTAGERCRELVGNIRFLIGLNCFFANNAKGVEQQLARLGLKEENIKRFFYATGIPCVELFDGAIKEIPGGNENFSSLNLGCLLCYPSYTARLSDVTFGKTMSEEWGWNDVICRSRRVDELLHDMEAKKLIEARDTVDGGTELLQSLLEAEVFKVDAIGYAAYLETGKFSPDQTASAMLNRPGGTISGRNRLTLIQAVRKYSFYEPAVAARKNKGIFVPELK